MPPIMETSWNLDMSHKADFGQLRSMLATPGVTLSSLWPLLTSTKKTCAAEFHTIWVPYLQSFEHVLLRTLPECSCFEDARLLDELFPGSPMEYTVTYRSKLPLRALEGNLFLHMQSLNVTYTSDRLHTFFSRGLFPSSCHTLKLHHQKLSGEQWIEIFEQHLTTVTRLSLSRCNISHDTFEQLLHTPGLNNLVSFKLGDHGVEKGALVLLADSSCMTRLEELDLEEAPLTGACLDRLSETDWAPALRTLHLCTRALDDSPWSQDDDERSLTRLAHMLESPWFQRLTHLSFRVHVDTRRRTYSWTHSDRRQLCPHDRACGELFSKACPGLQLTSLDLRGQHEAILLHLRQAWEEQAPQQPSGLKKLNLSYIPMTLPQAYSNKPITPPVHEHITWLDSNPHASPFHCTYQYWSTNEDVEYGDELFVDVYEYDEYGDEYDEEGEDEDDEEDEDLYEEIDPLDLIPGETSIYFTREDDIIHVRGSSIEQLIHGAWLEELEELELRHCKLYTSGLERLMKAPFIPHIKKLDLSHNHLDGSCLDWLLDTTTLPCLTHLDLSHNTFSIEENRRITQHCHAHGIIIRTTDPMPEVLEFDW